MTKNPWNVSDTSVFLNYCCPECDFQCSHLYNFEEHAVGTHELSKILFENNTLKEESSSEIFEPTIHLKEDFENDTPLKIFFLNYKNYKHEILLHCSSHKLYNIRVVC